VTAAAAYWFMQFAITREMTLQINFPLAKHHAAVVKSRLEARTEYECRANVVGAAQQRDAANRQRIEV
jgi:hypothetical protein